MPPERYAADDAREWPNRARSRLAHAKDDNPSVLLEDLCSDAQQAAEKALKAVLMFRAIPFPYVHDLAELAGRLAERGEELPSDVTEAVSLTDHAVKARYPSFAEPITRVEYAQTLKLAEGVVRWTESLILRNPG